MPFSPSQFKNISPKEAIQTQNSLREQISLEPLSKEINLIAGADISLEFHGDTAFAGIVVLSFPELKVVDRSLIKQKINFPYIPGLLSFREIPALFEAWENLKTKPDITVVDGHGIAHPRRMGIAAHFGLATDSPTIGIAESKLVGKYEEPALEAGSFSYLYDEKADEKIGAVVRTRTNVKPVFVSPGNKISLDQSIEIALAAARGYKLPEPTRQAHNTVNAFRRGEIS